MLFHPGLCICPGGNIADAATDAEGHTTFTGTIAGGGCVESLSVFADGVALGTVPVKTTSPDAAPASPCYVDASDIAAMAQVLGSISRYTPCFDFNGSGPPTVDQSDLAFFAPFLGAQCQ